MLQRVLAGKLPTRVEMLQLMPVPINGGSYGSFVEVDLERLPAMKSFTVFTLETPARTSSPEPNILRIPGSGIDTMPPPAFAKVGRKIRDIAKSTNRFLIGLSPFLGGSTLASHRVVARPIPYNWCPM